MSKLPALEEIIYCLEDLRGNENYWLNLEQGRLEEIPLEFFESSPELLGTVLFPLPPWTSEQGYQLMQEFALQFRNSAGGEEAMQILRSRRQVFKRFRAHFKSCPELKKLWNHFKAQQFIAYLRTWYAKEFPEAEHLHKALKALLALSDSRYRDEELEAAGIGQVGLRIDLLDEEPDGSSNLLHEDFELLSHSAESEAEFAALSAEERELRAFAILQSLALLQRPQVQPGSEEASQEHNGFSHRSQLWQSLAWVNRLELKAPSGELVALLFWAWRSAAEALVLQTLCEPEYHKLNLESYLLECFLERASLFHFGKVTLWRSTEETPDYADALLGRAQRDCARLCQISIL